MVSITYSEYVSEALVTQLAKRMRRIVLSSVACQDVPYFSILSYKCCNIFGRKLLSNMFCDFLYNFCPKYFQFCQELSEMWSNRYNGLHVKYPLFSSDLQETWIFSTDFRRILKWQMKILFRDIRVIPCGRTDRRTKSKQIFAFCDFANASENLIYIYIYIYIHRVIRKSLRNFRTRLRDNQDRHRRKEHINR
jgi:hypothetical protein